MENSKDYLGKKVKVIMDRPYGSFHPKWGFKYETNYGYIPNTVSGDGEELDAYVLGVFEPLSEFEGEVIAIIKRDNQDDDKLIVVSEGVNFSDEEINKQVDFQEKFFTHTIIRKW